MRLKKAKFFLPFRRSHRRPRVQTAVGAYYGHGLSGGRRRRLRPRRGPVGRLRRTVLPDVPHEPRHGSEVAAGRRGEEEEAAPAAAGRRRSSSGERGTGKEWPETERQWRSRRRRACGRRWELLWRRQRGRRAGATGAVDKRYERERGNSKGNSGDLFIS